MEKLLNKKTVLKVKNYLNKFDKNLSIISLNETARSSEEAGNSLNVKTGAIVKSLIFKSIDNDYYLCLISGDQTVSINKLSKLIKKEILKPNANEIKEITGFFEAHKKVGTNPGGVHLELTGDDVTECLGGGSELDADDLSKRYETMCDPRLNGSQSIDIAFRIAELLHKNRSFYS